MKSKFFKKINGKLSAVVMALCALLTVGGTDNISAKANETYPMTVKEYDGIEYAGVSIDKNNIDTFNETIDLSNCDLDTPIFQFVITPSQRGDGKLYTPDFEKLVFTLTDSKGEALSVGFIPRKADSPRWYYLCGLAGGQNQTLLGEHTGNYTWAETGAYLADEYAAISPYTFDGYGADFSWYPFYDKDGKKASMGKNGLISIYYDREENAIYADTGYNWRDDNPETEWTLTDKYKLSPNGERRYRIRDLDKADYKKGNSVISGVWEGFQDLSNINFKVSVSQKKNDNYSILLVSLNGNSLTGNYYLDYKNKGIVNKTLALPKPSYFSKTKAYDFIDIGGKVSIKDPDGNTVMNETSYTVDTTFIPTKAGGYNVEYSVLDPIENVEKTHTFKYTVLEAGGSTLALNGIERNYLLYDEINAGYKLTNNIQADIPKVFVTVKKDGNIVVSKTVCAEDFTYRFEQEGEYVFEYETTDYLGQTVTESFSCVVNSFALRLNEGVSQSVLYAGSDNFVMPTANDFSMINAVNGAKINPTKVDVKVCSGDGEWQPLTANVFANQGVYDILYEYHYNGKILSANRQIAIYETLPTILVEKVPQNTVLMKGESIENDSVKVKALKGTTVIFPYGYFQSSETIKVEKIQGENVEDITSSLLSGMYSISFEEEGSYCISASIAVMDDYVIRKNIFIEVKSSWIELEIPETKTFDVGQEIAIEEPKSRDFYGNALSNGTYKVVCGDKEIAVTDRKFSPTSIGVYTIVYTISDQRGSQSCEFAYYVVDRIAPIITTEKEKTNSSCGKKIALADVKVTDNSELDVGVEISVTYNGKIISIYDNAIVADKEGTYKVTIKAIDASGNTSVYSYEIQVGAKKYTWFIVGIIGGVAVLATGITLLTLNAKKKNAKGEENEKEEII